MAPLPAGLSPSKTSLIDICVNYTSLTDLWVNAPLQIAIKPSSLSKMKTIFTQEIFTEQVLQPHIHLSTVSLIFLDGIFLYDLHVVYLLYSAILFQ